MSVELADWFECTPTSPNPLYSKNKNRSSVYTYRFSE